jgi:hypothetical protein
MILPGFQMRELAWRTLWPRLSLKEFNFLRIHMAMKGACIISEQRMAVELDFLVLIDGRPILCVEVKTSDGNLSKSFSLF